MIILPDKLQKEQFKEDRKIIIKQTSIIDHKLERHEMFKGNPNLKCENVKLEYTKEQIRELFRCKHDPIYFINNYCFIVNLDTGLTKFKTRDYQTELINKFHNSRRVLVKWPRQSGKSITTASYALWQAIFQPYAQIGILANKAMTAIGILQKVRLIYENLPSWLQIGVLTWNKGSIELENGSMIKASSTSSSAIRSMAISTLIIDEVAFIPPGIWTEFFESVYPTISSSKKSKIFMISCVTKDTLINTSNGILPISNYIEKSKNGAYYIDKYKLMGKDGVFHNGDIFVDSGFVDTRILKTSNGSLECSHEHKMLSIKNDEFVPIWVKSKDLNIDDYLTVDYGHNFYANNDDISDIKIDKLLKPYAGRNYEFGDKITPNLSYFFGQLLGDGYFRRNGNLNQITISSEDDIGFVFDSLGWVYNKYDEIHYTINSKRIVSLLLGLGFNKNLKSKEKFIPDRLMGMSRENISSLLCGLFDADGTSGRRGIVTISLSSKKMIEQIKCLLLNIGIFSSYSEGISKPTKLVKVESHFYRLELSKKDSLKFYELIGFKLERKQKNIEKIKIGKKMNNKDDLIPNSKIFIRGIRKKYECVRNLIKFNGISKKGNHFNRNTMLKFKQILVEKDYFNIEELREYFYNVSENVRYLKIKDIKENKNEVFDFSLDNIEDDKWCHSVMYNGFLGHQTPKGMNHFYKFWNDSVNGNSEFVNFEIDWDDVPDRDEKFKRDTIAECGIEFWNQEYCCQFLGSAGSLISGKKLRIMTHDNPISEKFNEKLKIYKLPVKKNPNDKLSHNGKYVCIFDTSGGTGNDYSTVQVFRVDEKPYEQVALYRNNKIPIREFPLIIEKIALLYNEALVIGENNTIGESVLDDLVYDIEYENIFYDKVYGIEMNKKSKMLGNSNLKTNIEDDYFIIRDHDTIEELTTYTKVKSSYEADKNKHDDTVTPLVIFSYFLRKNEWVELWLDQEREKIGDKAIKAMEDDLLPIGFVSNGESENRIGKEDNSEYFMPF